ncbi:exopolysaccharide biosynthesis polyprenyl glycosylphosphotransferase [Roseomonas rosea]|uniref:Exopolysaccharide biosynthesis polyprenyl glycosylphosphotransferase n=1 Tax=Muricoccus roseus TaxID=198092 RepID=A0A1M6N9T6_9PROT|nr:exopolysaccharide biosynthesis polyprenyl glycosylphosphotransferase [Roseomonas rosea]SHJ92316.1 exopolysaccharide biosynthesis polyprenyl glycosylphosphotransferase [Roseomonas rosea]
MKILFGHSIRPEILGLYAADSFIIFSVFYFLLISGTPPSAVSYEISPLIVAALLAVCTGLAAGVTGLYQPGNWLRAGRILSGTVIAALLVTVVGDLLAPDLLFPHSGDVWAGALRLVAVFVCAVVITRVILLAATRLGLFRRRIVLLGANGAGPLPLSWPAGDPFFEVVATLPATAAALERQLPASIGTHRPWAVVADDLHGVPAAVRQRLQARGVRVFEEAEFWERRFGRIDLQRLREGWLAGSSGLRETAVERVLRRGIDIGIGVLLLTFAAPLLLLAAIAIRLESSGPIFYRQERVGLNGRTFTLFKLRSMVADAEVSGQARWAVQGDPRVTRVGRFLRLTRIDEIPQVLNVLRGDMAFVGPRPERPVFVTQLSALIPHYADRAVVKPGITGWAQVNYPYGASVEDARQKLSYDLYYVKRRSLFLDLLILVATVRVVLFQEGSR